MALDVIFCDNHLLIVQKPAGMPTQFTKQGESNLQDTAKNWVKKEFNKPGNAFLEPVHRLDKSVSGLVLFARTSKALTRLNEMMRARKIEKTYYAFVEGEPSPSEGTLEHYLIHGEHKAEISSQGQPDAKYARLQYRFLKKEGKNSLLEILLETGRYHQIRAQLSTMGWPIVGDSKYGSKVSLSEIALHHGRLRFAHPVTKEELVFEVPFSFSSKVRLN